MKKINKTVLLASTLFITSAVNLADKSYANEDNKSLVKESVDEFGVENQEKVDNIQDETDNTQKIEDKSYTNLDYSEADGNNNHEDLQDDNDNQGESLKEFENEYNASFPQDLADPNKIEEDGDATEKRLPGVIYYDDRNLDDALKEGYSYTNTNKVTEVHNEQSTIQEENYYSKNSGGYFLKKNNKIRYYKNNKVVKNANIKVKDRIYRADNIGALSSPRDKWLSIGKDIYYNNKDGNILKGISWVGKNKYYFSDEGTLQRNKKLITQGSYSVVDNMGRMNTEPNKWVNVNKKIYRTLDDGRIAKGVTKIGDKDYMFDKNGVLQTNKKMIVSDKYYEVSQVGVVTNPKNKWFALDGVSYRTIEDGSLAKGPVNINGNTYVFNYQTGAMITGRPSITNGIYFNIDNKGIAEVIKDEWVTYQGKTFHTNNAGYVKKGVWEINGNLYCFDDNGLVLNSTYMQNGIEYKTDAKGIAQVSGYKVAGEKNLDYVMDWMFTARNNGLTYDMGHGRTTEQAADCSSAVFRSLIYGGFLKSDAYIGNTETLFSMGAKGDIMYEISPSEIDYGDIFVAGVPGRSLGEGGHTGFILNKNRDTIIHMNYSGNGVTVTPRIGHMGDKSGKPIKYFRLKGAKSDRIFVDKY